MPAIRLAVGLGDPERERDLIPTLVESGELVVVQRCLSAVQVFECVRQERIDAVVVAEGLHRLTGSVLADLARSRMPMVLLATDPDEPRWRGATGLIQSLDDDPNTVHQAILAAIRGERSVAPTLAAPRAEPPGARDQEAPSPTLAVVAVASGPGSPGRTTIALNLAAALGVVAPTVLVDIDLSGPSVAAHVDADPTRNLYMLAHAEPETDAEWSHAIRQEIQSLGGQSVHGVVICGVPKLELRTGITPRFIDRLIQELRRRYRYVILDIGAELLSPEAAPHRAALQCADLVLLVGSADLVGLWHARTGLALLQSPLGIDPDRVALVINRHSRRLHHSRGEIEWALGLATAATIPNDHEAVQSALSAQRPLILHGRGPVARSLLDLAERMHGGTVKLPPDRARRGRFDFLRRVLPMDPTRRPRLGKLNIPGRLDDEHHTHDAARTVSGRPRPNR
jgi:MinD-like ATPase involved in chromosome partitioning or flagellar assembly